MVRRSVNYCLVDFDRHERRLTYRGLTPLGPLVEFGTKNITEDEVSNICKSYWNFVDDSIKNGELTGDIFKRRAFYDTLMTRGTLLVNALMDISTRDQLWGLARQSDILYLVTSHLESPWEALFNADQQVATFLAHECVLTRWPQAPATLNGRKVRKRDSFTRNRVILLDGELANFEHSGGQLRAVLLQDGEEVFLTTSQSALVANAKNVRMVHWICEHEKEGLRLRKGYHYNENDALTHHFPNGSVLILTSCQAGRGGVSGGSIASNICSSSNCTVIAPSSLVATHIGVEFARKLNVIAERMSIRPITVASLWRAVLGNLVINGHGEESIEPEMCFALWYGIYGNADHTVKE